MFRAFSGAFFFLFFSMLSATALSVRGGLKRGLVILFSASDSRGVLVHGLADPDPGIFYALLAVDRWSLLSSVGVDL